MQIFLLLTLLISFSGSVPLGDTSYGLSDVSGKNEDGLVTCTFFREPITDVKVPNQNESVLFDLDNSTFYLLMAKGPVDKGTNPKSKPPPLKFRLNTVGVNEKCINLKKHYC